MQQGAHSQVKSGNLIELRDVTVYRGSGKVFDRFSLSLPLCQNTVILGPNGAGKSTFLKILMRELYPVKDGESVVRILNEENWNVWELRSRLGFVSQDLQARYLGHVAGSDVVLSGFYSSVGTYQHQDFASREHELVKQVAGQLDVLELLDKPFYRMSTGEQRRFLLARALINAPFALILDEPTSGLDPNATFKYLAAIRRLMQGGTQIVLVTHHIHEIPPEIDHVVLLKDRKVIACGRKCDLLNAATLSELYEVAIQVVEANGYFQIVPDD